MFYKEVIWIFILHLGGSYSVKTSTIGLACPYCTLQSTTLSCNFRGADTVSAFLGELNQTVTSVYVSNLQKLKVDETVCANMMFYNISEITTAKRESRKCPRDSELTAWECSIKTVPRQLTKFYLKQCVLKSLSTDATMVSLTAINSLIHILEIAEPLSDGVSLSFYSTKISTLQKVILHHGSQLYLQNSVVHHIAPKALIAEGGHIYFKNSSIDTVLNNSISLSLSTTLNLENYSGNLVLTSIVQYRETQKQSEDHIHGYGFLIAFIITLWILVVVLLYQCKGGPKENENLKVEAAPLVANPGELTRNSTETGGVNVNNRLVSIPEESQEMSNEMSNLDNSRRMANGLEYMNRLFSAHSSRNRIMRGDTTDNQDLTLKFNTSTKRMKVDPASPAANAHEVVTLHEFKKVTQQSSEIKSANLENLQNEKDADGNYVALGMPRETRDVPQTSPNNHIRLSNTEDGNDKETLHANISETQTERDYADSLSKNLIPEQTDLGTVFTYEDNIPSLIRNSSLTTMYRLAYDCNRELSFSSDDSFEAEEPSPISHSSLLDLPAETNGQRKSEVVLKPDSLVKNNYKNNALHLLDSDEQSNDKVLCA